MNIRAHWEAELKAGVAGQDRQLSGTWAMDGLFFAACYETSAVELQAEADGCKRRGDLYGYRIWLEAAEDERRKALAALAGTIESGAA